jgi:hypothetical protein
MYNFVETDNCRFGIAVSCHSDRPSGRKGSRCSMNYIFGLFSVEKSELCPHLCFPYLPVLAVKLISLIYRDGPPFIATTDSRSSKMPPTTKNDESLAPVVNRRIRQQWRVNFDVLPIKRNVRRAGPQTMIYPMVNWELWDGSEL